MPSGFVSSAPVPRRAGVAERRFAVRLSGTLWGSSKNSAAASIAASTREVNVGHESSATSASCASCTECLELALIVSSSATGERRVGHTFFANRCVFGHVNTGWHPTMIIWMMYTVPSKMIMIIWIDKQSQIAERKTGDGRGPGDHSGGTQFLKMTIMIVSFAARRASQARPPGAPRSPLVER